MIEVTTNNTTRIVIAEFYEVSIDNFLDQNLGSSALGYCDGYLLHFKSADSDYFDKGIFENYTRYYRNVIYCKMPKYESQLKNKHGQALDIIDYSNSPIRKTIVQSIKEKKENNK